MTQIKSWWSWINQQDLMVKFTGLRMAARTQRIPIAWEPDRTSLGGIPVASCFISFPSFTLSVGFFLLSLRPRPLCLFIWWETLFPIELKCLYPKFKQTIGERIPWLNLGRSLCWLSPCARHLRWWRYSGQQDRHNSVVMELPFSDTVLALCLLLNAYQEPGPYLVPKI